MGNKRVGQPQRLNEARALALFQAADQLVWVTDAQGKRMETLLGVEEITGRLTESQDWDWRDHLHPGDRDEVLDAWEQAHSSHSRFKIECRLFSASGEVKQVLLSGVPLCAGNGAVREWIGTLSLSTGKTAEQAQSEIETLRRRLRRVMIETHHRVGNSLQVIAAIAEAQIPKGEDIVPVIALKRISLHAQALAEIHRLLTREARKTGEAESIPARDALGRLLALQQSVIGERRIISRIEDMELPLRQATSLCVLVNELINNAVRHGQGDIALSLTAREGLCRLEVYDRGPGFPVDFAPDSGAYTGIGLLNSVVRWDLRGETIYRNLPEGGAQVIMFFPLPAPQTSAPVERAGNGL